MEIIVKFILQYAWAGTFLFSFLSSIFAIMCFSAILKNRKEHRRRFTETKADTTSLKNNIERMRQSPPRLRIPYEERLKAEYERRGMKWETTGKS